MSLPVGLAISTALSHSGPFIQLRLAKFKGIPAHTFYLHLKETEFHFNHGHGNLYCETLRILRNQPALPS